ncbi:MAG: T9SS type A sorting domain-containing protein [Bacteroidota bacterium]
MQGRIIRTTQMISSAMNWKASVDISEYPNGVYLYRLIHRDTVYTGKFIKTSIR